MASEFMRRTASMLHLWDPVAIMLFMGPSTILYLWASVPIILHLWVSVPIMPITGLRTNEYLWASAPIILFMGLSTHHAGILSSLEAYFNMKELDLDLQWVQAITDINALSCFGQCTSLLELTPSLACCEGLLDVAPLSSLEFVSTRKSWTWTC